MENYSSEIVNNIKQEPERHFVVILPADPEPTEELEQEDESHDCDKCGRSFETRRKLYGHRTRTHSEFRYQCDRCDKLFNLKSRLARHIETHYKVSCPICQQQFGLSFMKKHVKRHSNSPKIKCKDCGKFFWSRGDLIRHNITHKIDRAQCDLCNKTFKNKFFLKHHIEVHMKFPCSLCGKPICNRSKSGHMKLKHSSKESFLSCAIKNCRLRFSNVKELKEHQQIHIGIRRFKCPKCDYETFQKFNIDKHLKTKSHRT